MNHATAAIFIRLSILSASLPRPLPLFKSFLSLSSFLILPIHPHLSPSSPSLPLPPFSPPYAPSSPFGASLCRPLSLTLSPPHYFIRSLIYLLCASFTPIRIPYRLFNAVFLFICLSLLCPRFTILAPLLSFLFLSSLKDPSYRSIAVVL